MTEIIALVVIFFVVGATIHGLVVAFLGGWAVFLGTHKWTDKQTELKNVGIKEPARNMAALGKSQRRLGRQRFRLVIRTNPSIVDRETKSFHEH